MARVMAIGAHFDDIELGCGGALCLHHELGDTTFMYVLTDSEYTHWTGTTERTAGVALGEGRAAAAVLGARLVEGGLPTKELRYDHELIERIEEVLVRHRIDVVYTHWDADVHQDHSAIGRATLNAARHIPSLLMYRSNWYFGTVPFKGNHFVDITPYIDRKERAIRCHATEVAKRGEGWIRFFRNENANSGQRMGIPYAEELLAVKFLVGREAPMSHRDTAAAEAAEALPAAPANVP